MSETWKELPGHPGYLVSDLGRVKSPSGTVIKPNTFKGYQYFQTNQRKSVRVHRAVLLAFVGGPPEDAPSGGHINGKRDDNRLENLKWVSAKENYQHAQVHGTATVGERIAQSRLTEEQVIEMRRLRSEGMSFPKLAKKYGVGVNAVQRACYGITWKHLGGAVPTDTYPISQQPEFEAAAAQEAERRFPLTNDPSKIEEIEARRRVWIGGARWARAQFGDNSGGGRE